MRRLITEFKQTAGPLEKPLAVLPCGRGETIATASPGRVSERVDSTPFGFITRFQFEQVSYTVFRLRRAKRQQVVLTSDHEDAVCLVYMLEGMSKWYVNGVQAQVFRSGEHHHVFVPKGSTSVVEFAVHEEITLVVVGMEESHFRLHLPRSNASAGQEEKEWVNTYAADQPPLHIMPDQFTILYNIIDCKRPAYIRHHYIRAKIEVLLALHLEQSIHHALENQSQGLREEELQRVYKVRDMLSQKPNKSYSLVGLAHAVGTNDATLKKHFKQVFGTTVFAYLTACRMELAKSLLLKNNQKVAVVAQEVGYKHASHFSTAFRKYFGYLPTKLLRSLVCIPVEVLFEEPWWCSMMW